MYLSIPSFTVIIIESIIFHFILWAVFQYCHYLFCWYLYFQPTQFFEKLRSRIFSTALLDRNSSFIFNLCFLSFSGCPIVLGSWESLYKCMPLPGPPHGIVPGDTDYQKEKVKNKDFSFYSPKKLSAAHRPKSSPLTMGSSPFSLLLFHSSPRHKGKTAALMTKSLRCIRYWKVNAESGGKTASGQEMGKEVLPCTDHFTVCQAQCQQYYFKSLDARKSL